MPKIKPTLEDLKEAYQAAGRAGDNEAANELAREIENYQVEGESDVERERRLYGAIGRGSDLEGYGRSAFQGQTFGFGDEIEGAGAAAAASLLNKYPDKSYGELYELYRDAARRKLKMFREEKPVASTITEMAGALPTALATPLNIGRGLTLGTRIGSGAATGAIQGGIYGAGAGEGTEGRLRGAGLGAITAGTLGAAAPLAGNVARNIGSRWRSWSGGRAEGISTPAYAALNRVVEADAAATGSGAQNIARAGEGAMLADAGPATAGLLDTSIQQGGRAARMATEALDARTRRSARRLRNKMDKILGVPEGVKTRGREIAGETKAMRRSAYDNAYNQPIDYAGDAGRIIEDVLSRIPPRVGKTAIDRANEMMTARYGRNFARHIMAEEGEDGVVRFTEMPNVMQLDYIKRALQGMGRKSIDALGRATDEGEMYTELGNSLRAALGRAVPAYDAAVKRGATKIDRDLALMSGYDMLKTGTKREDVRQALRRMEPATKAEMRLGVRNYIDDLSANVKAALLDNNMDAREAALVYKTLLSRANQEKLSMLLGPRQAGSLLAELRRSGQALGLRANVAVNSKTFARTAADAAQKELREEGPLNALYEANLLGAARDLGRMATGRTAANKQEAADAMSEELVRALALMTPKQSIELLRRMGSRQAAPSGRGLADPQAWESFIRSNAPYTHQALGLLDSRR